MLFQPSYEMSFEKYVEHSLKASGKLFQNLLSFTDSDVPQPIYLGWGGFYLRRLFGLSNYEDL